MPQLLVLAAVGAGAYLGVKWLRRKAGEFQDEFKKAMDETGARDKKSYSIKDIPTLKPDPETGVYRIDPKE